MIITFGSDIHGNGYAYQSFLQQQKDICPDLIVFGGDVFGYYYDSNDIITSMRNDERFHCLLGNHDEMFLKLLSGEIQEESLVERYGDSYKNIINRIDSINIDFIRKWNPFYNLTVDGIKIGFFHGGPKNPLDERIYPDTTITEESAYEKYDYIFCGHTHHKHMRKIGNCTLINAGSLGQQRDGKGCSYVVFDTKSRKYEIKIIKYDYIALENDIRLRESSQTMQNKLIEVLYRGIK